MKFNYSETVKSLPRFILSMLVLIPMETLSQGAGIAIFIVSSVLIGLAISVYYFITDFKEKNNYKTILLMFGILSLLMLAVMPNYTLQYLFGYGNIALRVILC